MRLRTRCPRIFLVRSILYHLVVLGIRFKFGRGGSGKCWHWEWHAAEQWAIGGCDCWQCPGRSFGKSTS